MLRQALLPDPGVERLDERVVRGLPGAAEIQPDLVPVRPLVRRVRRELRPAVHADDGRQRALVLANSDGALSAGHSAAPTLRLLVAQPQAFFAVQPVHALGIDLLAFRPQQYMEPAIAVSHPGGCQLPQSLPQRCLGRPDTHVAQGRAWNPKRAAGSALADSEGLFRPGDHRPPVGRLRASFERPPGASSDPGLGPPQPA
jgi:hypothetical protein